MPTFLRWSAAAAALVVLVTGVVGVWAVFAVARPRLDRPPQHADAVVVLAGDLGDRMREARRLMDGNVAPVLVHAGTPDTQAVRDMCTGGVTAYDVVCLDPTGDSTTRSEARAVARLAARRKWESLVIVTSKPHASRAHLLFRRCTDADLNVVGTTPAKDDRRHEVVSLAYAVTLARGC